MNSELKAVVLGLLLPCDQSEEQRFLTFFDNALEAGGIGEEERPLWVRAQLSHWQADGQPTPEFRSIVEDSIYRAGRDPVTFMFSHLREEDPRRAAGKNLASQYFDIHSRLKSHHLMGFDEARQFLSFAPFIIALALEQRMSASEISRVLAARDARYEMRWRPVKYVLDRVRASRSIEPNAFEEAYREHAKAEPELLSDLTLEQGTAYVGSIAEALGCKGSVEGNLHAILVDHVHEPYLCILHYQLMILSFSDHAVTYAYEFSPRGQNVDFLTRQYNEAGIVVAQSAYLNNAKALLRFDQAWADGRTDHRHAAAALVSLLNLLESMAPLPKAELARFILALLHRKLRVSSERAAGDVPDRLPDLDIPAADHLLQKVAASGSATGGLIEQRIVDCYAVGRYGGQGTWRGIGDSVFAPNLFRKKLGDIEFVTAHATPPRAIGFEAHGGHLTDLYIRDHFDTYSKVLSARAEELRAIAPLADWSLAVHFIAHSFADDLPEQQEVSVGDLTVTVQIQYVTFTEVAESMADNENHIKTLNRLLVEPLNQFPVHPRVRQRFAGLLV